MKRDFLFIFQLFCRIAVHLLLPLNSSLDLGVFHCWLKSPRYSPQGFGEYRVPSPGIRGFNATEQCQESASSTALLSSDCQKNCEKELNFCSVHQSPECFAAPSSRSIIPYSPHFKH